MFNSENLSISSTITAELGTREQRQRLRQVVASDPAAGALVWRELELETALAVKRSQLERTRAEIGAAEAALDKLRGELPALEAAGITVSAARDYVLNGTGDAPTRTEVEPAKDRRPGRAGRRAFAIELVDLVRAGLVRPEEELVAVYKRQRFTARLQPDLSLNVTGKGAAPSLSWAGRMITPNNINGWRFWNVEREGRLIPLADLRDDLAAGASAAA